MLYRDFETQEAIDQEYDVESIHPDFDAVVTRFLDLSQAARAHPGAQFDVRFGPTLDEHVDVYPADGPSGRPVLLFVHGGYWRILSSKEFALATVGPLAHGIDVVVTNYSLAPKVTIDEITRQGRAAVAWVYEHAASWGANPDRIYAAGHSAGGQQTAMLLRTQWVQEYGLPADVIRGGVAISGVFDLRPLPYSFVAPALQLTRRTVETQSPALLPPRAGAPMVIAWGGAETSEFRRQSADFLAQCQAAGLDAEGLELARDDHFEAVMELNDPGSALTSAIVDLVKRTS